MFTTDLVDAVTLVFVGVFAIAAGCLGLMIWAVIRRRG
jgi:hypothetical protein